MIYCLKTKADIIESEYFQMPKPDATIGEQFYDFLSFLRFV